MWISKQFSVNCQPTIKQLSGCTQSSNLMSFSFQRLFGAISVINSSIVIALLPTVHKFVGYTQNADAFEFKIHQLAAAIQVVGGFET